MIIGDMTFDFSKEDNLEGCKICGTRETDEGEVFTVGQHGHADGRTRFYVRCNICGTSVPGFAMSEAVGKWNRPFPAPRMATPIAEDADVYVLQIMDEASRALQMIKNGISRLERINLCGIEFDSKYHDEKLEDGSLVKVNRSVITAHFRGFDDISLDGPAVYEEDGREYDFSNAWDDAA